MTNRYDDTVRSRKFDANELLEIQMWLDYVAPIRLKDDPAFARKYKSRMSASVVIFK